MFHSLMFILVLTALFYTTLALECHGNTKSVCCASYQDTTPQSLYRGWGIKADPTDGDSFGIGILCDWAYSCQGGKMGCCKRLVTGLGAGMVGTGCVY